ncbi:MAG: hypothetical protein ACR2GH_00395 [Pseudonocardia sp.]
MRHDLGYAPRPEKPDTPVGGARYLTAQAYLKRLCAPVAHHSAAACEAQERGLLSELDVCRARTTRWPTRCRQRT